MSDVKHVLCFFVTFSGSTDVKSVWDVKCVCVFVTCSGSMDIKHVLDVKHVCVFCNFFWKYRHKTCVGCKMCVFL